MSSYTNVVLEGGAPWGFRITGGKENNQPISIGRVTPGGKASLANLCRGDVILAIGGVATDAMTLSEGQNAILSSTQQLCFKIERSIHTVGVILYCPQPVALHNG
uniref:PDZ domain-containing protein n=1 Tax=Gadus morhua TaxID=8049 RepID=A0A8C5C091_GADMO